MGVFPGDQVEKTLLSVQGNPYRASLASWPRLGFLAPFLAAVVGLTVAFGALTAATAGVAESGLEVRDGVVSAVSRTGFAWDAGVREGQAVLATFDPDTDSELTVVGLAGGEPIIVEQALRERVLRSMTIMAVVAIVLAALAIAVRPASGAASDLATMVAMPLAALPLEVQGAPVSSTAAMALSAAIPAVLLIGRLHRPRARVAAIVALAAGLGVWTLARLTGSDGEPTLDGFRSSIGIGLTLVAFVALIGIPAWRGQRSGIGAIRAVDVLALALLVGVSLLLVTVVHLPDLAVMAIIVTAVVAYPSTRRRFRAGADRLVLAGVRETAAIEATERERTRMASELHDSSMQELSGVIRRLERVPEAAPERDALREVAQHLREVATGMRPPMLDDLGLVPALGFLGERAERPNIVVEVRVDDRTGVVPAERLPADVELELYRMCEEAVNNALAHARASRIEILGRVAPTDVRLRVADDGVGLTAAAMESARRRGRLGMVSLRRRAASIGADVSVSSEGGTIIEIVWRR